MSRTNTMARSTPVFTHEGAPAYAHLSALQALRRSVMSCLLWEGEFYEDGVSIATRISETAELVAPSALAETAIEARTQMNLRHVPLLLLCALARRARGTDLVSRTIPQVVQRADELTEFVALYAKMNKQNVGNLVLSAQVKKGLAAAFHNFDEYQLAKYDRATEIKLRDVLRLCHAKPKDDEQGALWKRLLAGELATPDTWEVGLSRGGAKKEVFEDLLDANKLGYMALLRNLRNMAQSGVDPQKVRTALLARKGAHRVLPFRYVAAARAVPQWEGWIDEALLASMAETRKLGGLTAVLVDVSGSMDYALSGKSDLTRMDAAAALAALVPCESVRVFTFSERCVEVPARRGMGGIDAIVKSQAHQGTRLGAAIEYVNRCVPADRLVVITDEQSGDPVGHPSAKHSYLINVASAKNGVGYGKWVHLDGFSESIFRFMLERERVY